MPKYKNVGGSHTYKNGDGEDVTVETGGVFDHPDENLRDKFRNKFELVHVVHEPAPPASVEGGNITPADDDDNVPEGTDVTAEFPDAVDGIRVTKTTDGWWVYDGDAEPIHEKALKKKDVAGTIKDYLGGK